MDAEILKGRLRGSLVTIYDPQHGAESDTLIWNGRKPPRRARLIVRAASAEDVAEAVRFAAANGLTVSPRGGGHQFTGIASQADIVVDLGALDALRLDVEARTARVEPAVTNARMAAALDRHGLAFPLGHCGSVPMSGYLLGGGIGWNAAEWGFACFSVRAVEVVLADGQRVTASATEHPDIFWAARGAGPEFFGIVTAYHLGLKEAPRAISTAIRVYPSSAAAELAAWAETAMSEAPVNVEFSVKVTPGPQGPMLAAIANVFARTDAEACAVHTALGKGAPEALQVIGPMPTPFPSLYDATDPAVPKGRRYAVDTVWSDARFGDILGPVVLDMARAPSAENMAILVLRPNAVPIRGDAAFSRDGRVLGVLYAIWEDDENDTANIGWLRAAVDGVTPICTGAYVGEADLERPDRVLPTLSSEARARLEALRLHHDPSGVFMRRAPSLAIAAE